MNTSRRGLLAAASLSLLAGAAQAQAWPSKPISLIVPFPAGGTTDVLARALADRLTQSLGQTVIVESKPGAGATLGADLVAKARPDGYTVGMGTSSTLALIAQGLTPLKNEQFAPIARVTVDPLVLLVPTSATKSSAVAIICRATR